MQRFFSFGEKKSEKKETPISQKTLMDLDEPLLNEGQIQFVLDKMKSINSPAFIPKTNEFPFNILTDGKHVYVLSNIKLGEGGAGVIYAAQEIFPEGSSQWVAIKESLSDKRIYAMAIALRTNPDKFWKDYGNLLQGQYLAKYPNAQPDEFEDKNNLLNLFKETAEEVRNHTYKSLENNAKTLEKTKGITATVFSAGDLVYSAMPLIRGHDLALVAGEGLKTKNEIFEFSLKDVATDRDTARLKWGQFLLNYTRIILDIILEVEDLHSQNYLHRDIKPSNFMLDEFGKVKLIDFDTCVKMKKGIYVGDPAIVGTANYQSPQMLSAIAEKNTHYVFQTKDDLYSLGKTLEMLLSEPLSLAIFALYPKLDDFKLLFGLIKDLTSDDPSVQKNSMNFLTIHFQYLVDALELENGLILQHDDDLYSLTKRIEHFRSILSASPVADLCEVHLTIDEVLFSEKESRKILTSETPSDELAKNLLTLKKDYDAEQIKGLSQRKV